MQPSLGPCSNGVRHGNVWGFWACQVFPPVMKEGVVRGEGVGHISTPAHPSAVHSLGRFRLETLPRARTAWVSLTCMPGLVWSGALFFSFFFYTGPEHSWIWQKPLSGWLVRTWGIVNQPVCDARKPQAIKQQSRANQSEHSQSKSYHSRGTLGNIISHSWRATPLLMSS